MKFKVEIRLEIHRVLIHSAYHDWAPLLHGINDLSSGLSQKDLSRTHQAIISWLSVHLSSGCDVNMGESAQHRVSFVSQVIKSVSEIVRFSGESGASYIPLAIQLTIEPFAASPLSPASAVFRECAPLFQNVCCKWLSRILAEYQSALLKSCRAVCEPLELLLVQTCTVNPQTVFVAISCTVDSALVFLPASQFKIVSDKLTSILDRIPTALFYKRFVSELQSMVDPDQLWPSVTKLCQKMFNSDVQEQSFQYLNKHLARWNSVSHWKSQAICKKYEMCLQKISVPVNSSNFTSRGMHAAASS